VRLLSLADASDIAPHNTSLLWDQTSADRFFGDDDDRLLETLVFELVEGDEHECPTFTRGGGRLDQQVLLLAALLVGAFLHGAHPQLIGLGRGALLA